MVDAVNVPRAVEGRLTMLQLPLRRHVRSNSFGPNGRPSNSVSPNAAGSRTSQMPKSGRIARKCSRLLCDGRGVKP